MKNKIIILFLLILVFFIGLIIGLNLYNQYDANRDGKVSASDYVVIKNYIMNKENKNE